MFGAVIVTAIVFAAAALLFIMKLLTDCGHPRGGFVVVSCEEYGRQLETLVRALYWEEVFRSDLYTREILLVSRDGCSGHELEERYSIVRCVSFGVLAEYIAEREKYKGGKNE